MKSLKLIYKLRLKNLSNRKIKKSLHEIYGIDLSQKYISNITRSINYDSKVIYDEVALKKILYLYKNIINTEYLVSYLNAKYGYNLTYGKILDLASRYNVKKKKQNMYKQSFISKKDEYEIKKLYELGKTANEIAEMFGYRRKESIYSKLDKLGVERRDWNNIQSLNKTYNDFSLKIIDTNFKANFIGLLLTDGYVNEERGYIQLELIDEDCIQFLAENIGVKYKLIDKHKENLQLRYRLTLYGKSYIKDLKRLALEKRKTFTTKTPILLDIEKRYIAYILRGAIDGDGWIRRDGREFFICSASESLIIWYKELLESLGFINLKVRFIKNSWNGIYQIRSATKLNIILLKSLIYKESFGMRRKYELLL